MKWIAYSGDLAGRSAARIEYYSYDLALMDQWNGYAWGLHPETEKTVADRIWENMKCNCQQT